MPTTGLLKSRSPWSLRGRRPRPAPTLIELGTNSLKFHRRESGAVSSTRVPFELGHEVYSTGWISGSAARAVVNILRCRVEAEQRRGCRCVATGAVRDARNPGLLLDSLREIGVETRVLSGHEEACLLAEGYLRGTAALPALTADFGGGSVELAYLNEHGGMLWASLPLGAIRLHHLGRRRGHGWNEGLVADWIEHHLWETPLVRIGNVHGVGGTVRAIAEVLDRTTFSRRALKELEERVRAHGPPAVLRPERARVLLPGLMVARRLLEHTGAETLTCLCELSVGRVLMERGEA